MKKSCIWHIYMTSCYEVHGVEWVALISCDWETQTIGGIGRLESSANAANLS